MLSEVYRYKYLASLYLNYHRAKSTATLKRTRSDFGVV
jgi:hypothetical protein